jgi:hypothetical protein
MARGTQVTVVAFFSVFFFRDYYVRMAYRSNGFFRPPRRAVNHRVDADKRGGYRLRLAEVGLIKPVTRTGDIMYETDIQ